MTYSARLPAALDTADLTHGERELARWAALPFGRKRRVALYLLRRLLRVARNEAYRAVCVAAWEAKVYARSLCASFVRMRRALHNCQMPSTQSRYEESIDHGGEQAPRWAAGIAYILLLSLPTLFAMSVDRQLGPIEEQAAIARSVRPSPCIWVDGDIWIEAARGYVRPRDPGYLELRQRLCGY
jgi:hypothetical protein